MRDDSLGKGKECGFAAWQEKTVTPSAALHKAIWSLAVEGNRCPGCVNQQQEDLASPDLLHKVSSVPFNLHQCFCFPLWLPTHSIKKKNPAHKQVILKIIFFIIIIKECLFWEHFQLQHSGMLGLLYFHVCHYTSESSPHLSTSTPKEVLRRPPHNKRQKGGIAIIKRVGTRRQALANTYMNVLACAAAESHFTDNPGIRHRYIQ